MTGCLSSTTTTSSDADSMELLEADGEVEVVGEAGTADEARSSIPLTRPDVAILDVRLPDGSGVEVCREFAPCILRSDA
jgi:DNA-binding NarL/FixJ family response regulator